MIETLISCPQCGDDAELTFPSAEPNEPDFCEFECHSCAHQFIILECGRCGSGEHVAVRTWCPECGPVPLCSQCNAWHEDDMAQSEQP